MRIPIFLTLSPAILSLAACGAPIAAPSLAPRPVEKQPIDMPAIISQDVDKPVDVTLTARVAEILARAEAGVKAFQAQRVQTEQAVRHAAGSPVGNEDWVAAQQALTALETARSAVRDAAADLDMLRQDPANAASGNRAAIESAAARLAEIDAAQSAAVASLSRQLS